jgi:hypothetical protein
MYLHPGTRNANSQNGIKHSHDRIHVLLPGFKASTQPSHPRTCQAWQFHHFGGQADRKF